MWKRLRFMEEEREIAGWGSAGVAGTTQAGVDEQRVAQVLTGTVVIRAFGGLRVSVAGRPIEEDEWPTSARRLLELLLCSPGHATTALRGASLLWPLHLERSALNSFHVALHALRRMLEPGLPARAEPRYVVRQGRTYRLCIERLGCDLSDFSRLLGVAHDTDDVGRMESALSLWRDGFLERSAEPFVHGKRTELRGALVGALERLGERQAAGDDVAGATWAYRRLLEVEPLREDIWARVAELHATSGDDRQALAVLVRCERVLRSAGIEPCGLIRDLRRRLRRSDA